jgi:protease secretion system membrane fusion protein
MIPIMKKKSAAPTEVFFHDDGQLTVNTDASAYARAGWFIFLVSFVGFFAWAMLAPLDKGVPMSGYVAKDTNRKAVQYLSGGTVQDILVKDGDAVTAGQVLVRMNDVQVRSIEQATRAQYFTARTTEARLIAELSGAKNISFPKELNAFKGDRRLAENLELQKQLFSSRQMALQSEMAAARENIAGLNAQAQGLAESLSSKRVQLDIIKEQMENSRVLAKDGYISRSRLLEMERAHAEISGNISEDVGNIARARGQVAELMLRGAQRIQEYQKEVRSQLTDIRKEAETLASRLTAQTYDASNVEVKAPVAGVIVGSTIFTRGGVVGPGAKMMEIVPADDALVVEGQLPVHLVDKVHVGLPVELIFSAFNANITPRIPGVVTDVAADRTVDEHTGVATYKLRARVVPSGAKIVADHKLAIVSGMPVELFVKTGERTMMSYLLKPVMDRAKTAMTEE